MKTLPKYSLACLLSFGLFLFGGLGCLWSQFPGLYFHHLNVQNGLTQGNNYFICKDSRGFVWISSLDGLNRYDGRQVKRYKNIAGDTTSLPASYIQGTFYEDNAGDLWFATYEAIVRYDRKRDAFRRYGRPPSAGKPAVGYYIGFREDAENLRIIVNEKELWRFHTPTQRWTFQHMLPGIQRMQALFDAGGRLKGAYGWTIEGTGLYYFQYAPGAQTGETAFFDGSKNLPALPIRQAQPVADTLCWLVSSGDLWAFNPRSLRYTRYKPPGGALMLISVMADGKILAAASKGGGLLIFDPASRKFTQRFQHDDKNPASLSANEAEAVYIDKNGGIWVSLTGIGVDYTLPSKIKFENRDLAGQWENERQLSGLSHFIEDAQGRLWCASHYNGLFVLSSDLKPIAHYCQDCPVPYRLKGDDVAYVLADRRQRVWAFNWFGLQLKMPGTPNFQPVPGGVRIHGVELHDGRVLGAPYTGGIAVMADSMKVYTQPKLYHAGGAFTYLYQDKRGLLWAGRDLLQIWVMDPAHDFALLDSLPVGGIINGFYETPDGHTLWIATGNGLARFDRRTHALKIYTEADGLPSQYVSAMLVDEKGVFWLSTNRGLVQFLPATETFHTFQPADGLSAYEFNSSAAIRRANGEFWFGSQQGVNIFRPEKVVLSSAPLSLQWTQIWVNDQIPGVLRCTRSGASNLSELEALSFSHRDNTLSFEFTGIDYGDPAAVRYQYKMESYDANWVQSGARGFARYANLPPGTYQFYVKSANSDGIWAEKPRRLQIVIRPAFYQTVWFKVLVAAFLAGLAGLFYRNRIRRIRREALIQQRIAELESRTLRAQMNPHFIFNTLNAIKRFHVRNDLKAADEHLTRFASLVRLILDNSRDTVVSLRSELDLLEHYVGIERLRFGEKLFEYRCETDAAVDAERAQIPSIILQPFAENAILHGLRHKRGGGILSLRVCLINAAAGDPELEITLEDNGVGRAAAAVFQTEKTHQSAGVDITRRRVEAFAAEYGKRARLEINDLTHADGTAAGTQVRLCLPYLLQDR